MLPCHLHDCLLRHSALTRSCPSHAAVTNVQACLERRQQPRECMSLITACSDMSLPILHSCTLASKSNVAHAEALNSALFVVCLDTAAPPSTGNRMTDAALQCLHGGGSEANSANRWFDKTIQVSAGVVQCGSVVVERRVVYAGRLQLV